MSEPAAGALYVVATPIGNRGDLSPRARALLEAVDWIAAEDTRVSSGLLDGPVRGRLVSLHDHNERERTAELLRRLAAGASVALVSDAGTPLISDPGFVLVRAARAAGHSVIAVPGPCAAIAALSIAGLPTDRFYFAGFVAARASARRAQFEALASIDATLVLYASKRQAGPALAEALAVFGDRPASVCRELTKLHEEVRSGSLAELAASWEGLEQRGEFVLVIGGPPSGAADEEERELTRVLDVLLSRLSVRDAAAAAAELTGLSRKRAYALALALARRE